MTARVLCVWAVVAAASAAHAAPPPPATTVRSRGSGPWSAAETWESGSPPKAGDRVLIRAGDTVTYDVDSPEVIRVVQVSGTLEFAPDRNTRLEVGLLRVGPGDTVTEEGFACHADAGPRPAGTPAEPRAALRVGRPQRPIAADRRALIRLHHLPGMDPESCPAIVACGGRMEFHGAPLTHTWAKLSRPARAGDRTVWIARPPDGWRPGDRLILTATQRRSDRAGGEDRRRSQTEEVVLAGTGQRRFEPAAPDGPKHDYRSADGPVVPKNLTPGQRMALPPYGREPASDGFSLHLTERLVFDHAGGGEWSGEVANLSRNVVIESADPAGVRGHTMYHAGSAGSISYAEFRHLGKKGVLGRYSLHFHLCGDTLRGSSVVGASIWDSHNRWITVHGTDYLVIRDCVGYKSFGHGFFLEDGTEVFNRLEHNLAVAAIDGPVLPKSVLPFDPNQGAGFWWANCHNAFVGNVAADCEGYGFRFDARRAGGFDPVRPVRQADGAVKPTDIRSLPFLAFEGNEAHAVRFFGLNLRGMDRHDGTKDWYNKIFQDFAREARESQPDRRYPFWVSAFRAWDVTWAFHTGSPGVFLDGLEAYDCQYGIWRSVIDRHAWRRLSLRQIANRDLHMPFTIGIPEGDSKEDRDHFAAIVGFVDDFPPVTVITKIDRTGDEVVVRGVTSDCSEIRRVLVNGRPARPVRGSLSEWEAVLPASPGKPLTVTARAEDAAGNLEIRPHQVAVPAQP